MERVAHLEPVSGSGRGLLDQPGSLAGGNGPEPHTPLELAFPYYKLNAFEPFAGSLAMFGQGLNRGHLFEARSDHTTGRNRRWHAPLENIQPGGFYANQVSGCFQRFEVSYTWNKSLAAPSFLAQR